MLSGPPRAGGSVLLGAGLAALESASEPPLAFPIQHAANRLAAGRTAEARRLASRLPGWFMAPRPVAQGGRQQNFCCVTTRRRNFWVFRCLRRRWGALTARTLRLGVLGFGRLIQTPPGLPSRRLPAAHLPQAFGVLAVTLVPTPRLVLVPTAFAQADSWPRTSRTGTAAALWLTMRAAHGSVDLPRDSPGGTCYRSPRALNKTGSRCSVYTSVHEPDREGNCLRKAWPRRRKSGNQTVVGQSILPVHEPDMEGNSLKKAWPKRQGRTRPQRHPPTGSLQTLITGSVFPLGPRIETFWLAGGDPDTGPTEDMPR